MVVNTRQLRVCHLQPEQGVCPFQPGSTTARLYPCTAASFPTPKHRKTHFQASCCLSHQLDNNRGKSYSSSFSVVLFLCCGLSIFNLQHWRFVPLVLMTSVTFCLWGVAEAALWASSRAEHDYCCCQQNVTSFLAAACVLPFQWPREEALQAPCVHSLVYLQPYKFLEVESTGIEIPMLQCLEEGLGQIPRAVSAMRCCLWSSVVLLFLPEHRHTLAEM